jgi:hypothetical protein
VREGESAGSPGVRWAPGVGANCEATLSPDTRRRETRGRECNNMYTRRESHSCIPCGSKATLIVWKTVTVTATLLR